MLKCVERILVNGNILIRGIVHWISLLKGNIGNLDYIGHLKGILLY
jgi:hypothetical protein